MRPSLCRLGSSCETAHSHPRLRKELAQASSDEIGSFLLALFVKPDSQSSKCCLLPPFHTVHPSEARVVTLAALGSVRCLQKRPSRWHHGYSKSLSGDACVGHSHFVQADAPERAQSCLTHLEATEPHACGLVWCNDALLELRRFGPRSSEAGARVRELVFLRDMGVPGIAADDLCRIEVFACGLPIAHGVPVSVGTTVVNSLHADDSAHANACSTDSCLCRAEVGKNNK